MNNDLSWVLPLFVAVPLAAAAIAVIVPWRIVRDLLMVLVPGVGIIAGGWLFAHTAEAGTVAHSVGLYDGGIAIPFAADPFSAVMILTTCVVAFASNMFALVAGETRARFYPALTLMLTAGVNGALLTADLFNLFVFIEVMLLPSYGLIAMTGTWSRLAGGRMFVLVNLTTSTVLLIGVALVYGVAGTVNMAALAGAAAGNGPLTVAMGVVVIALCVKAGVFPVHTWLPRTYPGTSPSVMGLFSGLHTKVAVYALFRIYTVVFALDERWSWLIAVVCVVSMLVGGFAGLAEHTMRRVIAYQMVNGMPFILVVLAFATLDPVRALAAGILYALHHMITVGSLVLTVGAVEETYGTGMLTRLSGLMRREPLVSAVFVMGAFSVVGFPPFSGVWGKLYVTLAVAREGDLKAWLVIAAIIVASFGALLSMLRLWRAVFWGKDMREKEFPATLLVSGSKLAPGAALAVLSVAMFFGAGILTSVTTTAAEGLLDIDGYQQAILGDLSTAVGVVDTGGTPLQGIDIPEEVR
ncbi:monovalent cation/H+ antiporter subunit D family protein [Corynebacterium sp. CCM 9185]|uniref:Monovalent cation/H+ antiporter subunit D family protein n=1 Tax=Corynebacterium marambiense TaxID=2765364 RepID=A0ABS0VS80_9CORY|nr:monovalent cation/H+ antiporter subunit D family protein [Corynebacterium marambiense]MBI8999638.1 monovalent cation/H+ antiporter subunit D family protein [Corynebacterium marambiense]MCK7662476.1 monovalent cation/H+ antiporter subunit D family protein [Corynebacterium marambiense]MCX7541764.1 monovalent cation/H+ antiporter subunit D family protein [Corynebacterium marambiense]